VTPERGEQTPEPPSATSDLVEGLPRAAIPSPSGSFAQSSGVGSTRIGHRPFRLLSKCSASARFRPAAATVSTSIASGATIAWNHRDANRPSMTFKSERSLEGRTLVLKLSGRVQAEHLEQLSRELPTDGTPAVLDLTDVTLVDVAVVRFLAAAEARGIRLFGLSGFVREWMTREEKPSARSRKRKKQKK
jgi:hypothetical protein